MQNFLHEQLNCLTIDQKQKDFILVLSLNNSKIKIKVSFLLAKALHADACSSMLI